MVEASPTNIREVISGQRSVPHSIAALLRGLCAKIYTAADTGDVAPLVALADDIAANPNHWADAVTQNTPQASGVTALEMDMGRVPTGMASAFTTPGTRRVVEDTSAADQAAADKVAADKVAADKATEERATADRATAATAQRNRAAQQQAATQQTGQAGQAALNVQNDPSG
jgi:hypothetical protein